MEGKLQATSTLLDKQVSGLYGIQATELPDISAYAAVIEEVRAESYARNPKAKVLTLIAPLETANNKYRAAVKATDSEKAKLILLSEVAPANKTLLASLNEVESKLKSEEASLILPSMIKYLFLGSLVIILFLLPSTLTSAYRFNYGKYLLASLKRPPLLAISSNYSDLLGEDDEKIKESLGRLIFLDIYGPDFDEITAKRGSVFDQRIDVSDEIKSSEAYALLLSKGEAQFENLPSGVAGYVGQHAVLSYALICWMFQLKTEHKANRFDLTTEWNGSLWMVRLSTVNANIHESVCTAYQQALSKKAELSEKHHDEMDYLRTVLKRIPKGFGVEHSGGELHLVMTFESSPK
jgi:hypothetical protein